MFNYRMKIVKKVTKFVDNPNYKRGNRQKKKIEDITFSNIEISYLFDKCVPCSSCDGQIERLENRISFLEEIVKILATTSKSNEILSFLAKEGNANRGYCEEGCYLVVEDNS